ncbi:MAG: 2-hydroxychromene-2-carboxylate isomerase [Candidatus Binatus sp.]
MSKRVEFFYDYLSPFSYLADTRLPEIARRTGAEIAYRPILMGAIMKSVGNAGPLSIPSKAAYNIAEFQRWAKRYGVPAQFSPYFPFNTIRIVRGAIAAQLVGRFAEFHSAAFRAIWEQAQDLSKEEALQRLLNEAQIDPALIEGDDIKNRLRANVDEAVERGAFGAPTFFVNGEMFWGNDRLDFVEEALMRMA